MKVKIKISIYRKIDKTTNTLHEVFLCNLFNARFFNQNNTDLYHIIKDKIVELSIHKYGFELIDSLYNNNSIVYVYNIQDDLTSIKQYEEFDGIANIFQGENSCRNCSFIKNNKCRIFKNKKQKCVYWIEQRTYQTINWSKRI